MSFHRSTIPGTGTETPDGVASMLGPDHAGAPGRTAWQRRLVLTVLAVAAFIAAVFVLGPIGLIPFGLLLAFSTGSDDDETGRSVILNPRNVALAAAMLAAFAWFWLGYGDLPASLLVGIAGVLIALPLALQQSVGHSAHRRIVVTQRSLILALWGLVAFTCLYQERGVWLFGWRPYRLSCPCRWRRRGRGAPAGGGSNSGCSATRSAGICGDTCCRA